MLYLDTYFKNIKIDITHAEGRFGGYTPGVKILVNIFFMQSCIKFILGNIRFDVRKQHSPEVPYCHCMDTKTFLFVSAL